MRLDNGDHDLWRKEMLPQERVLWCGRPNYQFALDRTALWQTVPFLLMSALLLVSTDWPALQIGRIGFALPLTIALGLVWCIGYIAYHSVTSPRFTRYALTNKRALIHSGLPWSGPRARHLTPLTEPQFDGQNPGTIHFDDTEQRYGSSTWSNSVLTRSIVRTRPVGFVNIEDAPGVHALMQRVMEGKA